MQMAAARRLLFSSVMNHSEFATIDSADLADVHGGAEGETWEKTLGNVGSATGSALGGLLTAPAGGFTTSG